MHFILSILIAENLRQYVGFLDLLLDTLLILQLKLCPPGRKVALYRGSLHLRPGSRGRQVREGRLKVITGGAGA